MTKIHITDYNIHKSDFEAFCKVEIRTDRLDFYSYCVKIKLHLLFACDHYRENIAMFLLHPSQKFRCIFPKFKGMSKPRNITFI